MVLLRALSVAVLLLLSPAVWAGDAYHGTVAGVPDGEFAILAAQWGTGSRFTDVTEKARGLATDRGLDVQVERSHFGDPYPYHRKSLVVFYQWAGELRSATAPEHGRLRIPPEDADAAQARLAWVEGRLEAARSAARGRLEEAVASGAPAAIRKALRGNLRAARRFARRYEDTPGAEEAGLALRMAAWAEVARRRVTGMRSTTVMVSSSSDWRDLGIEAEAGDLVAIETEGEWKLGRYAGLCDATGRSGERYRVHSTVGELRHGCLLVRAGSNLFVAGTPHGAVRLDEDATRIEAKCNDETYRDNTGAITLRVFVLPASGREDG